MTALNLYKVIFEPAGGIDGILRGTTPLGFAFILAVDPNAAKKYWIDNSVQNYMKNYPRNQDPDVIRIRWSQRWALTELIKGPFEDGFIICNTANGS